MSPQAPKSQAILVQILARDLSKCCPGAGELIYGAKYIKTLQELTNKPIDQVSIEEVQYMTDFITWRNDHLDWANFLVDYCHLPMPSRKGIRHWDMAIWKHNNPEKIHWFRRAWRELEYSGLFSEPPPSLGPHWERPQSYVQAALALACNDDARIRAYVKEMVKLRLSIDKDSLDSFVTPAQLLGLSRHPYFSSRSR
jgi:hypothetical protein